jgi:hypothetical protein
LETDGAQTALRVIGSSRIVKHAAAAGGKLLGYCGQSNTSAKYGVYLLEGELVREVVGVGI